MVVNTLVKEGKALLSSGTRLFFAFVVGVLVTWALTTEHLTRVKPVDDPRSIPDGGKQQTPPSQTQGASPPDTAANQETSPTKEAGFAIQVLLPDGGLAEYANIEWVSGSLKSVIGWTPGIPAPSPPFGPREYQVRAFVDDTLRSDPVPLDMRVPPAGTLSLQLKAIPAITGTVQFPPGQRPHGISVFLIPDLGYGPPDPSQPKPDWFSTNISADKLGFAFRDVAPGNYLLVVFGGGIRNDLIHPLALDTRPVHADLVLPSFSTRVLSIRAYGPDGQTLRGVRFETTIVKDPKPSNAPPDRPGGHAHGQGGNPSFNEATLVHGPDGSLFLIPDVASLAALRSPAESLVVVAKSERYGLLATLAPEIADGEHAEVVFRFQDMARPSFALSPPNPRITVAASRLSPAMDPRIAACLAPVPGFFSPEGRLSFPAMQPGNYKLEGALRIAIPQNEHFLEQTLGPLTVTLASGEQELPLPAPRLYPLSVEFGKETVENIVRRRAEAIEQAKAAPPARASQDAPDPNSIPKPDEFSVGIKASDSSWVTLYKGPLRKGLLELPEIPAGEYALGVQGYPGTQRFRIPVDGALKFLPDETPGASIRLHLAEAPPVLIDAGCKDGDRIVGSEMGLFNWKSEAKFYLDGLSDYRTVKPVKLRFRRGSEDIEIEVDLKTLTDEQFRACFVVE